MIGYKNIAGSCGVTIEDIIFDVDDYVVFRVGIETNLHRAKIYYNSSGRPFFKFRNIRHYIDEFTKF